MTDFSTFEEAAPFQQERPGSQLRTLTTYEDVPAAYGVLDGDDNVLDKFAQVADAARFSAEHPGTRVQIVPA